MTVRGANDTDPASGASADRGGGGVHRSGEDRLPVRGEPRVPPGGSLESTIRRDAHGRWFHDGVPIEHDGISRSFDAWIDRHENGRYVLKNSVNWAFVDIEGAPIVVRRVAATEAGVELFLSDGRRETLDAETLRFDEEGNLYCQVRYGRLTARFSRQAMFDLEPVLDEDEEGQVFLRVEERRVQPPVTAEPVD